MSCYLNQYKDVLSTAGINLTKENRKEIDKLIHQLVEVEYKNCSLTRAKLKEVVANHRDEFIKKLQEHKR